jgi:hypothetical protein
MFIPARSHRMKASVKQRFLQSLSGLLDRPSFGIGLLQDISAREIGIAQLTLIGALMIGVVILICQLWLVSNIQSLVIVSESMIISIGVLFTRRHVQNVRGQAGAQAQRHAAAADELHMLRQAMYWHHERASVATCASLDELQRRATSQTMAIAGGNTQNLSEYQTHALQMLSTMVALRSTALESIAWREQQRTALNELWQIAGLLRVPDAAHNNLLQQPCTRFAIALDLDWLVILAPDSHAPLAPVLTIFGRATPGTTLNAAYLRIAAEALRCEQPLVRHEVAATVACLPVLRSGHAPMVLVARGAAAEEATQSMLMLLGDLLVHHYQLSYEWGA